MMDRRRRLGLPAAGAAQRTRGRPISYLVDHWSFDPFLVVAVALALLHELGLHQLAGRSLPARTRGRRRRSVMFYGGLVVLVVTVASPIDYWSNRYYWVHITQHLLLMFAAPTLVVASAPWLPLAFGIGVGLRRHLLRTLYLSGWTAPLRAVGRFLVRPWVAVVIFNGVMVLWHLPVAFDLAYHNRFVHVWCMHGSFFLAGTLFWLQFIPSYPFRNKLDPVGQIAALLGTNVVMFVLAVSQSLFSATSWYPVYAHLPGVTLSPVADQQIGAAILWVCGDLWCYPALIVAVRRLMKSDGLDRSLDRLLRRDVQIMGFERSRSSPE